MLPIFLLFLVCGLTNEAIFNAAPWLYMSRKSTLKPKSYQCDPERKETIQSHPPGLTLNSGNLKSFSESRVYIPSKPIPIKQTKESLEMAKMECEFKRISSDVDDEEEILSDSSSSSASCSPGIFKMSYDPRHAELRRIELKAKEERRNKRRAARIEEKKKKKFFTIESKSNSDGPSLEIRYSDRDDSDSDHEDYRKHRRQKYNLGIKSQIDKENSNDNDSDFGENNNDECFSLSF